jgi:hypothetical protein
MSSQEQEVSFDATDGTGIANEQTTTAAPSTEIEQGTLNEANEILHVRNVRMKINEKLMDGGKVPGDKESLQLLMQNLRDMDQSALTRTRIKNDDKNAKQQNNTYDLVTKTLLALRGAGRIKPVDIDPNVPIDTAPPQLPENLESAEFVPGEQEIGTITEDIDSFTERFNREHYPDRE